MDAQAAVAAQAAEDAIFKRVEAEMQRYGIVEQHLDKIRTKTDAVETPDVAVVVSRLAVDGRLKEENTEYDEHVIDSLLQQLKAREDPQEIAARSTEEERALVVRGLEKRLESSNLQELFTLEMTERQQQQQLEEQRQRLAMAQLEQQHQRMEDEASAQAQRSV